MIVNRKAPKEPPLIVKRTLLDRVIERFSPALGRRRYSERIATATLARLYEGAQKGRGTAGWVANGTSADAEISPARGTIRDRARDLGRNNGTAAMATSAWLAHLVGTGIRPRAASPDKEYNKKVDALFDLFAKQCDADGLTDFYGQQVLAARIMIEGGESLVLQRPRRRQDALAVPMQIQVLEGDHIDSSKSQDLGTAGMIKDGIQYDSIGRRTKYWLFRDHPGDNNPVIGRSMMSEPVDAARIIHLFERQRTQSRGVPWGSPAMRALRDIDDWANSEQVRKKMEACMVGVVFGADETDQNIAPKVVDAEGDPVEQFEPGLIAYARNGKSITFNSPAASTTVREWNSVMDHRVAQGWRMPYELMTGDLREVNFSSARVGIEQFFRICEMLQWTLLIPRLCQPVWDWFLSYAYLTGALERPDCPVQWNPPKFQSVNPFQDFQTDIGEVRAGFASPQEKIAKRGYNPEQVLQEIADWNKKMDDLGVVSDADPRRTTKGGQGQSEVAYDPETGEPITVADKAEAAAKTAATAAKASAAKPKGETLQ